MKRYQRQPYEINYTTNAYSKFHHTIIVASNEAQAREKLEERIGKTQQITYFNAIPLTKRLRQLGELTENEELTIRKYRRKVKSH